MCKYLIFFVLMFGYGYSLMAQPKIQSMDSILQVIDNQAGVYHYWLELTDDVLGQPTAIPVIILNGKSAGVSLGITAAIHGNEVNGIGVVHTLCNQLDINKLSGRIIAFPIINPLGYALHQREFIDGQDLNRIFPGKANGTESQQFVWQLNQQVLTGIDVLFDLHTASFGRTNTLYVRANLEDTTNAQLAPLMGADIVLDSKEASAGNSATIARTLRQEAESKNIPTLTIECGNPQVFQPEIITRSVEGILRAMNHLKMIDYDHQNIPEATHCQKSYWIYTTQGGVLDVVVALNEKVAKNQLIATQRDVFGTIVKQYYAPEVGVVIGKSTNPVSKSGDRIIHLGIVK